MIPMVVDLESMLVEDVCAVAVLVGKVVGVEPAVVDELEREEEGLASSTTVEGNTKERYPPICCSVHLRIVDFNPALPVFRQVRQFESMRTRTEIRVVRENGSGLVRGGVCRCIGDGIAVVHHDVVEGIVIFHSAPKRDRVTYKPRYPSAHRSQTG